MTNGEAGARIAVELLGRNLDHEEAALVHTVISAFVTPGDRYTGLPILDVISAQGQWVPDEVSAEELEFRAEWLNRWVDDGGSFRPA